jgi:hypothetical protein
MKGRRRREGQHQSSIRTLELLRRALEDPILLDNFENGGVSLLLDRRQLHHHPRADQAQPCNQGHQVKLRQEANAELDKCWGILQFTVKVLRQLGVGVMKPRHFLDCHLKLARDLGKLAACRHPVRVAILNSLSNSDTFASRAAF